MFWFIIPPLHVSSKYIGFSKRDITQTVRWNKKEVKKYVQITAYSNRAREILRGEFLPRARGDFSTADHGSGIF